MFLNLFVLISRVFDFVGDDRVHEGHETTAFLSLFTTHYFININYKICGVHY